MTSARYSRDALPAVTYLVLRKVIFDAKLRSFGVIDAPSATLAVVGSEPSTLTSRVESIV